jgi:hypothetical protein
MMYAGALYYLIGGSVSLALTLLCLSLPFTDKDKDIDHKKPVKMMVIRVVAVLPLMATTFLGSWLFWAGFVKLAGPLLVPSF